MTDKPVAPTREAADHINHNLRAIGQIELRLQSLEAEMNGRIDGIRTSFASRIQALQSTHGSLVQALSEHCTALRQEILPPKAKSLTLLFGIIGWRRRRPVIRTLRNISPETAAQRLRDLGHESLVRVTIEPNKPVILTAIDAGEVSDVDLQAAGLRVEPGRDEWYYEVDHQRIREEDK